MPTIEQMQNLPLSTDIATQEELNTGITNVSSALIGTNEDLSSADTINGSKKYAKEYANSAINTVISGAPQAFDTLKEIADWISSDQTSSTKLISDVAKLQTDMAAISNDLSIDISRVTVTEDDGFQKGNSLGFVGDSTLANPDYVISGFDSYAFPINVLTSDCGFTNEELSSAIYNYDSDFANTIYGYMYDNGFNPKPFTSLYGILTDGTTRVFAHYGSQYGGADAVDWRDSDGTTKDGTGVKILPAKVITLSNGTKVFREPRVYYYRGGAGDQNRIYTSFTLFVDYEAIPKKKVQTYDSIVSTTYATKSELTSELTDYVDLTSNNQSISGSKIFSNISATFIDSSNGLIVGSNSIVSRNITIEPEAIEIRHEEKKFSLEAAGTGAQIHVTNEEDNYTDTWKFHSPSASQTDYFVASEEFVVSAISSYAKLSDVPTDLSDLANSPGYIKQESISALSDIYVLSSEVVEGLSNTVVPKLSTIADLVSAEVERVDDISSAMNTQFVPLSDYQALETRVAALEARVSELEGN